MTVRSLFGVLVVGALVACGESDAQYESDIATQVHDALVVDIHSVVVASMALRDSAPTPQGRGWDAQQDALAITAMKNAWLQARSAYEHVEGAVAPQFVDLDFALDSRYEQYLAVSAGDAYAFDAQGVVGLDAVERILWSNVTPQAVVDYEATLVGYAPAAFPSTEQEAADFKNVLCGKLVADAQALEAGWSAKSMDVAAAYGGLLSLVLEQRDELVAGEMSAQESRYSQTTMDDLRSSTDGIESTYGLFRPWISSKDGGSDADAKIKAGLLALHAAYDSVPGDALPSVANDYTNLLDAVTSNVDPNVDGTIAFEMKRTSTLLGF